MFQAIVDKIAVELEAQLPPFEQQVVFSSRLAQDLQSKSIFRHPRNLWIDFQRKAVEYCEEPNTRFVLVSDIASYFENIDLRLLADTLASSGISLTCVEAVRQILTKWANGRTRGLPQMLAPCSLLGNVYLSQIDKSMVLFGYKYIRYVDDIRIFVSSEVELRQALLELTDQLKSCYLDVQSSKTQFYTAESHIEDLTTLKRHFVETGIAESEDIDSLYFQDPEFFDSADLAEEALGERVQDQSLMLFLNNILSNQRQYDDRHLRYCINRLGLKRNPAGRALVLSKLRDMPQQTATFVGYLSRIQPSESNVEQEGISLEKVRVTLMAERIEWMSVEQVAQELGVHPDTIRLYIREGTLPAVQLKRSYRINRKDLEAFLRHRYIGKDKEEN